jgi:hypothetical protein
VSALIPWLVRILAAALDTLGAVSAIATIVTFIKSELPNFVREHVQYSVEGQVNETNLAVNDLVFGNSALRDLILAQFADLTLQITHLSDGTTPVSLPVVPPSGYDSPAASDNASAVWNWSLYPLLSQAKYYMQAAGNWGAFSANLRWLGDEVKYFEAVYGSADYTAGAADWVPVFDPTDILVTETALTCLTRQNPGWTVSWAFAPSGYVRLVFPGTAEIQEWQTTFDQAGFAAIKAQLFPVAVGGGAPVWPGVAGATLGGPVALDVGLTVSGPMHGVLVAITSVPTKQGYFTFDTMRSWRNVGALAFVDDNGDAEEWQLLGFEQALFVPKSMTNAASCIVRTSGGVVGTVTPWVTA